MEQLAQLPAFRVYCVLTQLEQVDALEQVTQLAIKVEQLLQTFDETANEISMHFVQTDKLEH